MTDAFDSGRAPGGAPGMAAVPPLTPGAASDADLPRGPGQRLRQARLRRGLEVRQVAREMRLTVERVQAIEEDDYAALPDPVFVVGYLKTYARLMDLNPEALVAAYRTLQARSPVPPKPRSAAILPRVKSFQEPGGAKPAATPLPSPSGRPRGLGRFGWGSPSPSRSASSSPGTVTGQDRELPQGHPEGRPGDMAKDRGQGRVQEFAWAALAIALFVLLLALAWWTQRPAATPESPAGVQEPVAEHLTQPQSRGQEKPSREWPVAERSALAPGRKVLTHSPAAGSLGEIEAEINTGIESEAGIEAGVEAESELLPEPEPVEEEALEASGLPPVTTGVPGTDESAMTTATSTPEADVAQVVDRMDVVIRFTGPTSVDIRDSTMNYALVGEMDKGDQYLLGGKPPYSLILGNAAAVELLVGGKPFDFQSVVRGNVARFILDPAPAPALNSAPNAAPATSAPDLNHPRP